MTIRLKPVAEQVIVITGASSGIGLVTAKRAAAMGASVFLVARNEAALAGAVRAIEEAGGTAAYRVADVGDADQVRAAADEAVATFGRIDTWVNNAGVAIYARLMDTPLAEHRRMIETNYFGAVHGALAAVPHLSRRGGALVTVGSIASEMPSPIMGAYAASKHATRAYMRALRMELRADGAPVSITLVKPSGIDTPIAGHALNRAGGEARIPPPVYDPDLVAAAILDAAARPRHEITVGGAGRLQVLFSEHFPALFERLAPIAAKAFTDPAKRQPEPSNLFHSERAGEERSGGHAGRKTSVYTAARLHPATTAAIAATAGLALLAVILRRRGKA